MRRFGVPQSRRRVIVQAAARGVPLPKAPKPTHSLLRAVQHFDHRRKEHQAEGPLEKIVNCWAPHEAVTVEDAFSDLPAFTAEQGQHEGLVRFAPPEYPVRAPLTSIMIAVRYSVVVGRTSEVRQRRPIDVSAPCSDLFPRGPKRRYVSQRGRDVPRLSAHIRTDADSAEAAAASRRCEGDRLPQR